MLWMIGVPSKRPLLLTKRPSERILILKQCDVSASMLNSFLKGVQNLVSREQPPFIPFFMINVV